MYKLSNLKEAILENDWKLVVKILTTEPLLVQSVDADSSNLGHIIFSKDIKDFNHFFELFDLLLQNGLNIFGLNKAGKMALEYLVDNNSLSSEQKSILQNKISISLDKFSYDNVNKSSKIQHGIFHTTARKNDVFVQFYKNKMEFKGKINKDELIASGWKIHCSLNPEPDNLKKAWSIIIKLFMKYGIETAKIIKSDYQHDDMQTGKEITIYYQDDISLEKWQALLIDITNEFLLNGIKPGYLPLLDKPISGSSFFSVRCDKDQNAQDIRPFAANTYNPSGKSDHFFDTLDLTEKTNDVGTLRLIREDEIIKNFYQQIYQIEMNIEETLTRIFGVENKKPIILFLLQINEHNLLEDQYMGFHNRTKLQNELLKLGYSTTDQYSLKPIINNLADIKKNNPDQFKMFFKLITTLYNEYLYKNRELSKLLNANNNNLENLVHDKLTEIKEKTSEFYRFLAELIKPQLEEYDDDIIIHKNDSDDNSKAKKKKHKPHDSEKLKSSKANIQQDKPSTSLSKTTQQAENDSNQPYDLAPKITNVNKAMQKLMLPEMKLPANDTMKLSNRDQQLLEIIKLTNLRQDSLKDLSDNEISNIFTIIEQSQKSEVAHMITEKLTDGDLLPIDIKDIKMELVNKLKVTQDFKHDANHDAKAMINLLLKQCSQLEKTDVNTENTNIVNPDANIHPFKIS